MRCCIALSGNGIRPAQPREPGHVGMGRVKLGLVLDRKCGEIRVRGWIAGRPHPPEEVEQDFGMAVPQGG